MSSMHDKQYVLKGRHYRLSRQYTARQVLTEAKVAFVDLEDPLEQVIEVGRDSLPKEVLRDAMQECGVNAEPTNNFTEARKTVLNYMEACFNLGRNEDGEYATSSMDGLADGDGPAREAAEKFVSSLYGELPNLVRRLLDGNAERQMLIVDQIAPHVMTMIIMEAREGGITDFDLAELRMNGSFAKLAYAATRTFLGLTAEAEEEEKY